MSTNERPTGIFTDLDKLERDTALKKGFSDNGGDGLIKGGEYVGSLTRVGMILIAIVLMNFQLVSAARLSYQSNDLEAVSQSIRLIISLTNVVVISICLLVHREIIDNIFIAAGYGFFDYGDMVDEDTEAAMKLIVGEMRATKKKHSRNFTYVMYCASTSLLLNILVGYFRFGDRIDGEGSGVSRRHIAPMWFFGIDTWPGYIFMCFVAHSAQVGGALACIGYVSTTICFAEELLAQLEVVGIGLKNVTRRARHLYSIRYGQKGLLDGSLLAKCLRDVLKASVRHHSSVIGLCEEFRRLLLIPLLTVICGAALLICLGTFLVVEDSVPIIPKVVSITFLFVEAIYCYLYFVYGEAITFSCEHVGNQLYQDDWVPMSAVFRPYYIMIKLRALRPVKLSAGGFADINIAAFNSVLSSSYSYFNLMVSKK